MKETFVRAIRTFFQAAIGYIAANLAMGLSGAVDGAISYKSALTALIAAAVSCGLAAVMNLPKKEIAVEAVDAVESADVTASDKMDGDEPKKAETQSTESATEAEVAVNEETVTEKSVYEGERLI